MNFFFLRSVTLAFVCSVTDLSYSYSSSTPNENSVLPLYNVTQYWFPEFEMRKS
jgi:hypothetical protein